MFLLTDSIETRHTTWLKQLADDGYEIHFVNNQHVEILHKHPSRLGGGGIIYRFEAGSGLRRAEPVGCCDPKIFVHPTVIYRWDSEDVLTVRILY